MPTHQPFTIRDVRLFDGTRPLEATCVRVVEGRIDAIGTPPAAASGDAVVDGGGGTLLPGLIDAHVHLLPGCTQLAATFGVTTVVDQFSKPEVIDPERAAATTAHAGQGPVRADLRTSSIGATAPGGHPTIAYSPLPYVTGPADALPFVEDRIGEGATHLKVIYDDGSGAMLDISPPWTRPRSRPWSPRRTATACPWWRTSRPPAVRSPSPAAGSTCSPTRRSIG
ncbi:hypothetical protein JKP76_19070 [Blastococcus sp. TML/C7B]|uniref:hypothetical protein n=1 Tax=Blastococcus sp. TML/C7B TaxID=2798728 RepID=UPI00190A2508|nr:hypothetical protein [Blastococcus sp. TML/C7B]MBN1097929.1 hypothetical protein [Blastococcus sp. TML/C7B]